jgi:hypothetical protein
MAEDLNEEVVPPDMGAAVTPRGGWSSDAAVAHVQHRALFGLPEQESIPGYSSTGVYLWCNRCENRLSCQEVGAYEQGFSRAGPPVRYSLVRCSRCHSPSLVSQEWDQALQHWSAPHLAFPAQGRPIDYNLIPQEVYSPFKEAERCFHDAESYRACVTLCRKVIEATCVARGAQGQNLALMIKSLENMGLVEGRLAEWADELRLAGNDAVHGHGSIISKESAYDVLEFTHTLISYVFVLCPRFESFQRRRRGDSP